MAKQVKKKKEESPKEEPSAEKLAMAAGGGKDPGTKCPQGQYWNGTRCVKDAG